MSAYVKIGPRRRWPKPQSMELTHALDCLVTRHPHLAKWERDLLASVVGAYFVLVFSPKRQRDKDISLLRKLSAHPQKRKRDPR